MKFFVLIIGLLLATSCSTTKCENNFAENKRTEQTASSTTGVQKMMVKVKVYKPDGTLQCNQGEKISLDVMAKELNDIQIFSKDNKHDGLMRIQLCGKPTGNNNIFEIAETDLEKALSLGFKKWIRN
jgi:hypothetical protein